MAIVTALQWRIIAWKTPAAETASRRVRGLRRRSFGGPPAYARIIAQHRATVDDLREQLVGSAARTSLWVMISRGSPSLRRYEKVRPCWNMRGERAASPPSMTPSSEMMPDRYISATTSMMAEPQIPVPGTRPRGSTSRVNPSWSPRIHATLGPSALPTSSARTGVPMCDARAARNGDDLQERVDFVERRLVQPPRAEPLPQSRITTPV